MPTRSAPSSRDTDKHILWQMSSRNREALRGYESFAPPQAHSHILLPPPNNTRCHIHSSQFNPLSLSLFPRLSLPTRTKNSSLRPPHSNTSSSLPQLPATPSTPRQAQTPLPPRPSLAQPCDPRETLDPRPRRPPKKGYAGPVSAARSANDRDGEHQGANLASRHQPAYDHAGEEKEKSVLFSPYSEASIILCTLYGAQLARATCSHLLFTFLLPGQSDNVVCLTPSTRVNLPPSSCCEQKTPKMRHAQPIVNSRKRRCICD